jgi:hypothetical protein
LKLKGKVKERLDRSRTIPTWRSKAITKILPGKVQEKVGEIENVFEK